MRRARDEATTRSVHRLTSATPLCALSSPRAPAFTRLACVRKRELTQRYFAKILHLARVWRLEDGRHARRRAPQLAQPPASNTSKTTATTTTRGSSKRANTPHTTGCSPLVRAERACWCVRGTRRLRLEALVRHGALRLVRVDRAYARESVREWRARRTHTLGGRGS